MSSDGVLRFAVWPTHIGLGSSSPTNPVPDEPFDLPDYERGQITWRATNGADPIGSARVLCPKGGYDHLIFAYAPRGVVSVTETFRLPHPYVFDTDTWITLGNITSGTQVEKIIPA